MAVAASGDTRVGSLRVHAMSDRFDMRGIHARTVDAEMVEFSSRGYCTEDIEVREPMGTVGLAAVLELPIAQTTDDRAPRPALVPAANIDKPPEVRLHAESITLWTWETPLEAIAAILRERPP